MEEIQEERAYSKWEWFFYMLVIPALFASLLGGVLLSLLGVDVIGKLTSAAKAIPYVGQLAGGVEKSGSDTAAPPAKTQEAPLQTKLAESNQTIQQLKSEAAEKDTTIQAMQKQVDELKRELDDKRADEEARQKQFQDLAKVYTSMSSRNAASIIGNLSEQEAVAVLGKMKPDQQADILAKMDPKKAADISILLKDTTVNKDEDIAALQQRVQSLTSELAAARKDSASLESLISSFSQMNADDAANILQSMAVSERKKVISILAGMESDRRAQILASLSKKDEGLAARLTGELLR
ncbi:magnesium transporter MgtE N-terminal domain-containing protein [Brevibacillus massiliensis]|jgi:flagellar motility protein MotE (MotC chaperone)|uniref:magnesium transporter MgtE N-terminal domain-containing protein n=1 Tax=Brevibacillus massiliensis TaxID=1118054 RepID=UPI0002F43741|nr:hypothetical protein [Brevibacillus massiliensis]